MPRFAYTEGFIGRPSYAFSFLDGLYSDVADAAGSGDEVTFTMGIYAVTVSGSGLTTGDLNGRTVLTGGTLDSILLHFRSGYEFTYSGLGLDAQVLFQLAADSDPRALERALMELDWTIAGNSTNETVLVGDRTSDNTRVHFRGDDTFDLFFGNDRVWAGAGNDTIYGGQSSDSLSGGSGDDRIFGGINGDVLTGDGGRDRLFGGGGDDTLDGGNGRDVLRGGGRDDTLDGGAGRDVLFGGAGIDSFHFAAGGGADRIRDYAAGEAIVIDGVTSVSVSETEGGSVLITYDGGSVTLVGVAYATFDQGDIAF